MRRILLLITIVLFLAAGIGGWLLYSWGEKVIEQGIIELSQLEPGALESNKTEETAEAEPDTVKPTAGADKPVEKDIKNNSTAKPTKNIDNSAAAPSPGASSNNAYSQGEAQEHEAEVRVETEAVQNIKNKVPVSEKASLTKLLLSKLTKNDISELQGMLSNGITEKEKERAKAILYSRLSIEDINRIKDAYIKYTQ